jgi:hypothetical protein
MKKMPVNVKKTRTAKKREREKRKRYCKSKIKRSNTYGELVCNKNLWSAVGRRIDSTHLSIKPIKVFTSHRVVLTTI